MLTADSVYNLFLPRLTVCDLHQPLHKHFIFSLVSCSRELHLRRPSQEDFTLVAAEDMHPTWLCTVKCHVCFLSFPVIFSFCVDPVEITSSLLMSTPLQGVSIINNVLRIHTQKKSD